MTTDTKTPTVGMGASSGHGADCNPYTVIEVRGKTLVIQRDLHTPTALHEGPYGNQDYSYTPDPTGGKDTYTLRRNGQWVLKGDPMRQGCVLHLGGRRYHRDPSF